MTLGVLFMVPATGYAQEQGQETDPIVIAQAWVSAVDAHDFDAAVALLNDDSYLIVVPPAPSSNINSYQGKNEIRQVLQQYAANNTHVQIVDGPVVINGTTTWTERQSSDSLLRAGVPSIQVTVDALIEGGKIKSIVYELTPDSAAQIAHSEGEGGRDTGTAAPSGVGMPKTGAGIPAGVPFPMWWVVISALVVLAGIGLRGTAHNDAHWRACAGACGRSH